MAQILTRHFVGFPPPSFSLPPDDDLMAVRVTLLNSLSPLLQEQPSAASYVPNQAKNRIPLSTFSPAPNMSQFPAVDSRRWKDVFRNNHPAIQQRDNYSKMQNEPSPGINVFVFICCYRYTM